ncbi:ABC transporter permease [Parabacteroides sp. PF5-9]|uniref:ABC transporter permease n=1 Tax=Parabacteroides sp. PF5-9 TaxID=1742404 RepID=UPI0024764468|nr:ABC transporter permease [Parabacteroides sp. PF5-9]MDH6358117.1 ABC-2 type transport system permease protein [Parabacteroides sp. PF5-9]
MKQFISFLTKEMYHIFRDLRTMMIMLFMPIILIILFGYAITTEIKQVPIAVLDHSRDDVTRKITDRLSASEYFNLYGIINDQEDIQELFRREYVKMVVVFPPQYVSSSDASVQILVDATDPNEATQLTAYATAIIQTEVAAGSVSVERSRATQSAVMTPVVHLLYNPLMKGAYNFVPGVMGLILILICAIMTSVGIVKEKEMGTMEILLVSPLKPIYIILAKALPYLLLSIVNICTILFLSYFLLDVPIKGSLYLLIMVSILYAIVSLSLGLLISTIVDTQQAAMLISAMVLMLPVMLLSGMMFPVENMPLVLQWLSNIVPAKWYIIAAKDIMIKGVPAMAVMKEVAILLFMALFIIGLSVKRFKVRLH